jgi:mono/diheme cytochrome c family protein
MSTPHPPDEPRTDALPETDVPGPGGSDNVLGLHKPHMDIMNDPVMLSAEGLDHDEPDAATAPGGQDTVQTMHITLREQAEPRDGFEPVPMWVPVVFAALLMWGGYYLGANSAGFRRDRFDTIELAPGALPADLPETPEPELKTVSDLMKVGEAKYKSVCAACHKPDGNGDTNPSQPYPPLAGSEWVAGPQASPARLARIVLFGLQGQLAVKGKSFAGQMPAQGAAMKDYEIAAVITYVRNSFGNKADPDDANPAVTPALVKAVRAKGGKRAPLTADELQRIPLDYSDLPPAGKK